jgi:signal transduction histidine kinase
MLAKARPDDIEPRLCDDGVVPLRLVVCAAGLALGGFSLALARDDPAYSFAGTTPGGAALLAAGWALLLVAVVFWARRPGNAVGPLLVAAGGGWFLAEWDNPGAGSGPVFTTGLVVFAACPPLVGWAMLAYPSGRLAAWADRLAVAAALTVGLVALGLLPALFFDPPAQGCAQCPENLLVVSDDPGLADDLSRVGLRLGLASSLGLVGVTAWRVARSSAARRRLVAPVTLAGSVYLGLVAWTYAVSLDRGFVGTGGLERRLWLAQAATLVALALAVGWGRVRVGRARSSLARLVVELGESARAASLREALARTLGDPQLTVAYPVGGGRHADVDGREVELQLGDGRTQTPLVRDRRPVAVIVHRRGLLDDPDLVEEVASAARLVLQNERLRAEVRAQEEDLRASRARIVEAGDAERRGAERDLHDGAQQRLVGLLVGLRLARAKLGPGTDGQALARLDEATAEIQRAVDDLRELAHGIHPAALSDEGLAAALEALAERTSTPLRITGTSGERFPPAVENAVYRIVAEAAKTGATQVRAASRERALAIDVHTQTEPEGLQELEDRVGALDGRIRVESIPGGGIRLRAVIPVPRSHGRFPGDVPCG